MADLGNSMDMPFGEIPDGQLGDTHVHYSGGIIVMSAVVDVPGAGPKPALIFKFADPAGGFYPPIVLVTDDDQMAKLVPLIQDSVATARRRARAAS